MALDAARELEAVFAAIEAADGETLADMRAATLIPAPFQGEAARGRWVAGRLEQTFSRTPGARRAHGLIPVTTDDAPGSVIAGTPPGSVSTAASAASMTRNASPAATTADSPVATATTDAAGNVLARWGGGPDESALMVAAHLDTVFPVDVSIELREHDGRMSAPGISDNSRGLAALLRLAAVLPHFPPLTRLLLLVATVGEEGAGDLRGVKHLFHARGLRPAAFIAVDGAGLARIIHRSVGSRRLRVRVMGPGGHSWSDRQRPNPVHALAGAVAGLEGLRGELGPDVGLHVGRIGGGTSVNAIPEEAWLELDLRSESAAALVELETRARSLFAACAQPPLCLEVELMGDRPGGMTPADSALVQAASAATDYVGGVPELTSSSTDANVPMALGIPAIALGAGGEAGGTHTVGEWYRNERGPAGLQRLALTILLADRLLAGQVDGGVVAEADDSLRIIDRNVVADH